MLLVSAFIHMNLHNIRFHEDPFCSSHVYMWTDRHFKVNWLIFAT